MKDISFLHSAFSVSCNKKSAVTTAEMQLPRPSVDSKSGTQQTQSQLLFQHNFLTATRFSHRPVLGERPFGLGLQRPKGRIIAAPKKVF